MGNKSDVSAALDAAIVIYDGECLMCSSAMRFILDKEIASDLLFTTLDSHYFDSQIRPHFFDNNPVPDSVMYIDKGHLSIESDAALGIANRLRAPYKYIVVLRIVPKGLRDLLYRWIAKNRKKWFGTQESCELLHPNIDLSHRILL